MTLVQPGEIAHSRNAGCMADKRVALVGSGAGLVAVLMMGWSMLGG
jgi:hypothetical protein